MILDSIDQARRYVSLHSFFSLAFSKILDGSIAGLPAGRHELAGEKLTVSIGSERRKPPLQCLLEAHRRYIDIHVPLKGDDLIGWKALGDCVNLKRLYDAEKDVVHFSDEPSVWLKLGQGCFAVFFPDDAHAPLAGEGTVRKAVFKVMVEG